MIIYSFVSEPFQFYMDRVKITYAYLDKTRNGKIWVWIEHSDYSALPDKKFDWELSVYGEVTELLPDDVPTHLVNYVRLTHYVDANLFHDQLAGYSVTCILNLSNKTPVDFYYKKESTLETATYGYKFVSARTCVEKIIYLRNTI